MWTYWLGLFRILPLLPEMIKVDIRSTSVRFLWINLVVSKKIKTWEWIQKSKMFELDVITTTKYVPKLIKKPCITLFVDNATKCLATDVSYRVKT